MDTFWIGGLLFAILLFMPALLLVTKPDLAVVWMNSLGHIVMWKPPHRRTVPTRSSQWRAWNEIAYIEKVAVCLLAAACLVFGVLILRYTLVQIFSVLNLE
ncbi:MAG: hypothetical protein GY832_31285 [Chloroflexi bacterium]|nr:hypothetical protein [Chloroflexota bacterium]